MNVFQMQIPKVYSRVMPMAEKEVEVEAREIEMDLRLRSLWGKKMVGRAMKYAWVAPFLSRFLKIEGSEEGSFTEDTTIWDSVTNRKIWLD